MPFSSLVRHALCLVVALSSGAAAVAQELQTALVIELNALDPVDGACQFSFVATNRLGVDLEAVVLEAVLFDQDYRVERLTLFGFDALPAGRPRLRQFLVPDLPCSALGRILVNGVERCEGVDLLPARCTQALRLENRTSVEVLG